MQQRLSVVSPTDEADDILRKLSFIETILEPAQAAENLQRKLNFLIYEYKATVNQDWTTLDKLEFLRNFVFHQKRFKCADSGDKTSMDFLIDSVLTHKRGSPLVLGIILSALAKSIGVSLEFIELNKNCLLKTIHNGKAYFIDPLQNGKILNCNEFLALLNKIYVGKSPSSQCMESLPANGLLLKYLNGLKESLLRERKHSAMLKVLNVILEVEPSDFKAVGERALLFLKLGSKKEALSDLKRYFTFAKPEAAHPELRTAYDELRQNASVQPPLEVVPTAEV